MKFGPKETKQLNEYLRTGRNRNRQFLTTQLVDDLEPGPLKDELLEKFDPSQETYEEYLQRKNLERPFNMADGGMLVKPGFDGTRQGYAKVKDALGRVYDSDKMGRPAKLEGKVGRIVEYLKDLPKGASFYKPDVAKLLNLGTAKDGSIDTSLLTKAINSRKELKNKNFKFLTKTDVTINKINNFIQSYVNENKGKLPSQGEIQKGAKVDPTRLRKYITEGLIKNVADTVFDKNTKVANYILESENPTIKGIEKIVGKGNANKILTRVYINSLRSTKDKLNKIDEGRSVYKNFNLEQVDLIKNKLRKIPGFESIYEREITDLVADAYPGQENLKKKKAALKKIAKFKELNKTLKNKFGVNLVLDHPLDYDFITKTAAGSDPTELIRVRPLPDRVNLFKGLLTKDFTEVSETLKKGFNQTAYNKYLNAKSIADELKIPFPTMSKKGTIISTGAAKIGDQPIIGDVKQSAVIQNKFRNFVQNISNDPRIQRLGINLKELKDLAKLPKIDIPAYNRAVKKFALQGGKFGVPFVVGAGGIDFLKKQGIGFDQEFEQTADLTGGQIVPKGLSTEGKIATGAAVSSLAAKPVRTLLGKTLNVLAPPTFALDLYDRSKAMSDTAKNITDMEAGMEQDKAIEDFAAKDYRGFSNGGYTEDAYSFLKEIRDDIRNQYKYYRSLGGKKKFSTYEKEALRKYFSTGGLSGGDKSGPPPERGPNSQGLLSLMKRGMKI